MATAAGPKSVNDGLIYFIDPSNVKSYSGVGTVIYDLSGNGKTSYFTNGALYQNYSKGVVNVDGNNDYISTPLFSLTTPVTVSAWVKNVINFSPIFGSTAGYGNAEYIFYYENKTIVIQGSPGGAKYYQFPQLNLNEWVHLTMTRDVANNMRVYLNGIGSTTGPQNYSNTLLMNQIGRYSSFTNIYNPRGSIGEVKIYNRALSASEISQNYNATRKKYLTSEEYVRDSLVLNLDFGNSSCYSGTGVTAYDLSGFGHTTYLINGASYNNAWGGNIFCDGGDDYIEAEPTSALEFGNNNFSVEYWYRKVEYTTGTDNIWGPGIWRSGPSDPSNNEWVLAIGSGESGIGESGTFYIQGTSSAFRTSELPLSYNLNKFNHMVGIRNNNQIQLYYNGILLQSTDFSGTFTTTTSVPVTNSKLRIGNSMLNSLYTKAHSGVVRLYRKALTADEVTQNYRALLPRFSDPSIITEGLILNYDFGSIETFSGSNTSVYNLVGTGLTGNTINGPTYSTDAGGSLNLDGANDYVFTNNNILLQPANLTIELWFKLNVTLTSQPTSFPLLIDKYSLGTPRSGYRLLFDKGANQLQFSVFGTSIESIVYISGANTKISTNYNCVHGTFDGTSTKIYLNGVLEHTVLGANTINYNNEDLYLGAYFDGGIQHNINSRIYKLAIYNKALTENEISQNYNAMRYRF
jgi:hypothetical protein